MILIASLKKQINQQNSNKYNIKYEHAIKKCAFQPAGYDRG